ncbi:MAG: XRE family transcriptional regulator [Prevotella sp.]|nr:XRE family transcriptional regulator [Prevotella sp.]
MENIGQLIKVKLKEQDKTVSWFAEQMCCSRTNAYKIFERQSMNTDDLVRISSILKFNFFEPYYTKVKKMIK